jgi:hypothetical protein
MLNYTLVITKTYKIRNLWAGVLVSRKVQWRYTVEIILFISRFTIRHFITVHFQLQKSLMYFLWNWKSLRLSNLSFILLFNIDIHLTLEGASNVNLNSLTAESNRNCRTLEKNCFTQIGLCKWINLNMYKFTKH